jgi:hypothetical protein
MIQHECLTLCVTTAQHISDDCFPSLFVYTSQHLWDADAGIAIATENVRILHSHKYVIISELFIQSLPNFGQT